MRSRGGRNREEDKVIGMIDAKARRDRARAFRELFRKNRNGNGNGSKPDPAPEPEPPKAA